MKNIFQKSAMAIAVASLSVSAFAGDLDYTGSGSEIVLANEVFGAGSEETLIAIPDVTFTVDSGTFAAGGTATVKFTLNRGAVFGEDLSSIDKWEAAGVVLEFEDDTGPVVVGNTGAAGADFSSAAITDISVDQGGAIGDNTVTFLITAPAGTVLESARIAQVRVKGLTSALARGVDDAVSLGAEFRSGTITDTDTALVIFRSQDGVALATTQVTDYDDANVGLRARIDVADTELSFTGALSTNTGSGAAQDFDDTDNVAYVDFGNLRVVRTTVDGAWGGGLVKKENGQEFDFNGSDEITVTISSTQPLDAYESIFLRTGSASSCAAAVTNADFSATPSNGATSVDIDLTGETTIDLSTGYRLCAVAAGETAIPESSFTATLNVEYFNPRYTDSTDTLSYGQVLRNGCAVTLFNLPTTSVGDDGFIRLTNVSELPGAVRASVWTEDGRQIDVGEQVTAELAANATVVLHTNEGLANGVFLGDVLPEYAELTQGRHRIQLQGAFPACEAMGLIRTPAGVLVNMTSTTYSGDDGRLGSDQSNTSNTSN